MSALYRIHWVHKSRLLSAPTLFDLRACSRGARGHSAPLSCTAAAAAEDSKPGPDPLRGCCRARRRTMCCQRPGHSNIAHIRTRAHMHYALFTYMHKPPSPSLRQALSISALAEAACACVLVCVFCVRACVHVSVSVCEPHSEEGKPFWLRSPSPHPPPPHPRGLASKKEKKGLFPPSFPHSDSALFRDARLI